MNEGHHYRPCRHGKVNRGILGTTQHTDLTTRMAWTWGWTRCWRGPPLGWMDLHRSPTEAQEGGFGVMGAGNSGFQAPGAWPRREGNRIWRSTSSVRGKASAGQRGLLVLRAQARGSSCPGVRTVLMKDFFSLP